MTIKKKGSQWCVITSRSEECFGTKSAAAKRLKQIEFFKNRGDRRMKEYRAKPDDDDRMMEIFDEFLSKCAKKTVIPDNRKGLPLLDRTP